MLLLKGKPLGKAGLILPFSAEAGNSAQDFKMLARGPAFAYSALSGPPCLSPVLLCISESCPLKAPELVALSQWEAPVGDGKVRGWELGRSQGVFPYLSILGIISGSAHVSVTHQGSRLDRPLWLLDSGNTTPCLPPKGACCYC